jgi:hypothetical protein
MDRIWNLGLKVGNLETELEFLAACGATGIKQGMIETPKAITLSAWHCSATSGCCSSMKWSMPMRCLDR